MAKSISAPWIKAAVLDWARSEATPVGAAAGRLVVPARKGKVVQVLRTNDSVCSIEVSDKESSISVMLTEACYHGLVEAEGEHALSRYRNCIVKLDDWHLSTIVQAASNRDLSKFGGLSISFPFALQCSRLVLLGAADCTRIGEPTDVNRDPTVRQLLTQTDYASLISRLRTRQFPGEASMPDHEGVFSVPPPYGQDYPLLWEHAVVPPDQQGALADKGGLRTTSAVTREQTLAPPAPGSPDSVGSDGAFSLLTAALRDTQSPSQEDGFLAATQVDTQADTPHEQRSAVVLWQHGHSLVHRLAHEFSMAPPAAQSQQDTQLDSQESTLQATHQDTQRDDTMEGSVVEMEAQSWFTQPLDDRFILDVEMRMNGTPLRAPHVATMPSEAIVTVLPAATAAPAPTVTAPPVAAPSTPIPAPPLHIPPAPVAAPSIPVPSTPIGPQVAPAAVTTPEPKPAAPLVQVAVSVAAPAVAATVAVDTESDIIGRPVKKKFKGFGVFTGKVESRRRVYTRRGRAAAGLTGDYLYRVVYEDGDAEEMGEKDVKKILVTEKSRRNGSRGPVQPAEAAAPPTEQPREVERGTKRKAAHTTEDASAESPRKAPRVAPTVAPTPVPVRGDSSTLSKNLLQALSFLQTIPASGAPRRISTAAVFKTKYS